MKINESIEIFLPISIKKPNDTDILGAIIKFINQLIGKKGQQKSNQWRSSRKEKLPKHKQLDIN